MSNNMASCRDPGLGGHGQCEEEVKDHEKDPLLECYERSQPAEIQSIFLDLFAPTRSLTEPIIANEKLRGLLSLCNCFQPL